MIIKRFIRVVLGIILLIPLCSCSRFVTFREAPEAYLLNKGYLLISPNIDVIYRFSEIFVPMPELPAPDLANEGVVLYIETDLYGYVKRVGVRYSPHPRLSEALLEIAGQWVFEAHEHEGIPRPAQFGMELCFKERENKLGIIKGPNSSVPRFIRNPLPVYPKLAQKRNLTDLIEIEVITDIYGATRQARIKHGKHRILKKSALTAVKKWVHDHATLSGVPRPCIYTVLFRFHGKTKPFCVSTVFIKTDAAAYPLGKTQDETKVYVDARGNELSENDFFNDAKTGKIVTYFDSGASEEEGDKGAKGAGDDGAGKKYEESFLDGVRHGAFHGWYRSGKKRISGFFRKGKKDGTWTCWRENGKVLREGVY